VARERTTKGLAKRIELTYYQKPHGFRKWWRHLCIGATALAVLWILVEAVRGDQRIYTSGPVATAHRMFETDCARCHVTAPKPAVGPAVGATSSDVPPPKPPIVPAAVGHGGYFARVSDGACLACHDGTIHHDNMTQDFTCATCHLEHKVGTTLARMSDRHCTVCHADLQTKGGKAEFEPKVPDLAQHPEIALFRKNIPDPTVIKLNHRVHLKTRGRSGPEPLGCQSCHVEDDAGKYMKAMSYDRHCKACHPLTTSDDVEVPHQRPEAIQAFLQARAGARGGAAAPAKPADKPAEEEQPTGGRKRGGSAEGPAPDVRLVSLFGAPAVVTTDGGQFPLLLAQRKRGGEAEEEAKPAAPSAPAAPAAGGAPSGGGGGAAAAAKVKELLADKRQGCPFCHTVQPGATPEALPTIVPPKIPVRWQQHATFDHRAHRPLACAACHEKALQSEDTADILLPKLQACRECHREGGGARAGCVECHLYHDRAKERSSDGPFKTVPGFVAADGKPAAPAAPAEQKKP
jgi:hypothetical protein